MAAQAENAAAPGGAAAGTSLYVVGIDANVTDSELYSLFSKFGEVVSVEVCEDLSIGLSLRYGYVHYRNPQCAQRALEELNFTPLNGKPIRIMAFHQGPSTSKSDAKTLYTKNSENKIDHKALPENFFSEDEAKFNNVFVRNLCESTTKDDLENIFGEFGRITSAAVMTHDDGTSKCFGFVNFQNAEDAAMAVESLDGQIFGNRNWYVGRAQKKHERQLRLKQDLECVKYAFDNGCNLFIKNLDRSVDEEGVKELFSMFGSVTSCRVLRDEKGYSREQGLIAFSSAKEASDALSGMNGKVLLDKPLHVAIAAQRKEERRAPLQNSGKEIDRNALPETFSSSEDIRSCKVATHASGHSKGYDSLQFAGEATGQEAIGELYSIIREVTVVISKLNSNIGKLNDSVGELNGNVMKLNDGLLLNRKQVDMENSLTKDIELIVYRANLTDVFVKKLCESTTEEDLKKIFDEFGLVTDAVVMRNADGTSKCFGFVSFKNAKDAAGAVESLNGQRFDKTKWFSGRAQKKLERELEQKNSFERPVKEANNVKEAVDRRCNLYVKNLDFSIDDEKFMELFSSFGLVTSFKLFGERKGRNSGLGFVAFSSPEEASKAILELNGKIICGKPLYVALAQKKEDRMAQLQNSDRENDRKALPEASVSSVDKEVDKGTNQRVGKSDRSTPRGRLSEVFSPVTSLKSSKGHPRRLMHSMSVALIHNQQRNSQSAKAFPVQKNLQPALETKQQIIPREHDHNCPLGGSFSVQYETGRLSLNDVVKSQSVHIGALAYSLANASSLNRGGRCWMRYCSRIVSRCRLNS